MNDESNTPRKPCTKCGQKFPATTEYFTRRGKGLHSWCKSCRRQQRTQNKDKRREYIRHNADRIRQRKREYRQRNADRIREYNRQYNSEHVEWRHKYNRDYGHEYYLKNRERILEQNKDYRERNADVIKKRRRHYNLLYAHRVRQYKQRHIDRIREYNRLYKINRRARKRSLRDDFTIEQQQYALEHFNHCCAACGRQFHDLFGERTLSLDHWIPLSSPDCPGTTVTNMIPLCHGIDGCNSRKNARDPNEWLVSQFGKRKAREILGRIEAYFEVVRERWPD